MTRSNYPGGADWSQAVSKALGVKLGAKVLTLEEAVESIDRIRRLAAVYNEIPEERDDREVIEIAIEDFVTNPSNTNGQFTIFGFPPVQLSFSVHELARFIKERLDGK